MGDSTGSKAIRRLRVCLLGGETAAYYYPYTVSKSEVAAALLRGLTADEPEGSDPILDLVYDMNMFEIAWRGLQQDGIAAGDQKWDRWGLGAAREWEGRIRFEAAYFDEATPSDNPDPSEEYGSVVASDSRDGIIQAFHEVLKTAGQTSETFEAVQRELFSAAEACPRALVCREQPCPGLAASHARFSPEVGDFGDSCAVILHVFDQGFWPWSNHQSTAMLVATVPDLQKHVGLPPRAFLCAIRAIGSNITRAVREYNRLASAKPAPSDAERTAWFHTDTRAQVESFMSDMNLWSDKEFQQRVAASADGWVDLEFMKGHRKEKDGEELIDAELLDILGASKYVETKVGDDGHILVRRPDAQEAFHTWASMSSRGKKYGDADDPRCWDFVRRGYCPRGDACRYAHTADMDEAKAAMEKTAEEMAFAAPSPDAAESRILQSNSELMVKLCQAAGLLAETGDSDGVSDPQFLSLAYGMAQYNAAEERSQLRSLQNARVVAPPPKSNSEGHAGGSRNDSVVLKPWASSGWSDRGTVKPPKPPRTAAEAAAAAVVTPGPAPPNRVQTPPATAGNAGQGIHVPPPPHAAGRTTDKPPPAVNPPPPPPRPREEKKQGQSDSKGETSTKRTETGSAKRATPEASSTKAGDKAKASEPATKEDKDFMDRMLKRKRRFEGW